MIEDSGNDHPGTYTTSLCNVTAGPFTSAGDLNGGPIVSADVKTGTMSGIGDIDGYTFTGTNGNRVLIDAVATAGAGYNTGDLLVSAGRRDLRHVVGRRRSTRLPAHRHRNLDHSDRGLRQRHRRRLQHVALERHRRPAHQRQRHRRRRHRLQRHQDRAIPAGCGLRRVHVHGIDRQSRRHGRALPPEPARTTRRSRSTPRAAARP